MRDTNQMRVITGTALVAVILYLCYFSGVGALGLTGPDEPRYAAISREMAATGDWVTPRLFGQPWFEKPVLYYWSAALAFRSGLTNESAARLPSGVYALLATLGMAGLARRFYGGRTALLLLLMLPTCVMMIGFAHAAATDMPFAACLALAMAAAARIVWGANSAKEKEGGDDLGQRMAWACIWGFFLGLASLAKGPAALVLASGSMTIWVLATRRWRDALCLFHPAGIACFCFTALPWYVLCALRNPTFLRVFLLEHNFERFATNRYQHAQPFWFFAPILLLALFPWTFLLGACGADAFHAYRLKRLADAPGFFFACWAIFPFLFFSVSQSKLPGYILPAVPPLILLMARSLERLIELKNRAATDWMIRVAVAFVLLAVGVPLWIHNATPGMDDASLVAVRPGIVSFQVTSIILFLLLAMISGAIGVLAIARRWRGAVWTAALAVAMLVAVAGQWMLPALDSQLSPRETARLALERSGGANPVAVYQLSRAWRYGLNFYFGREIPEWAPLQRPAWVITNDAGIGQLERLGVKPHGEQRISRYATILQIE